MRRLHIAAILLGFICLLPNIAQAMLETSNLDMFVGEIKVLENVDAKRVAIGNGSLLKMKTLPKGQLLIIAEGVGSTSVRIWYKDGREQDLNIRINQTDQTRRLRLEDMIKMDVRIIEFRKSALKSLCKNLLKSINGPGFAYADNFNQNSYFRGEGEPTNMGDLTNQLSSSASFFGIATSITSRINYLASNGDAFTLAEPNLSCVNGGKAEFLAGGEVPIPVRGANGEVVVTYKKYGIKLEIEPQSGHDGVISTKIMTEVSQIDPAVSVMDVPGFLTRRTSTQMNVRDQETIVISGMLNSENSKDVDKIPLLGDIPIIGHLFKSTDFRDAQTELAIFVTPRIVSAASQSNRETVNSYFSRSDERKSKIGEKLNSTLAD